jgi:hypothetical protein
LSAADFRNIYFIDLGGYGTGAVQRTLFRCVAGALGNGVSAFNLRPTLNVSFEKMFIDSRDAAFTGMLLDWGDLTYGSALMAMTDCCLVLSNVIGARYQSLRCDAAEIRANKIWWRAHAGSDARCGRRRLVQPAFTSVVLVQSNRIVSILLTVLAKASHSRTATSTLAPETASVAFGPQSNPRLPWRLTVRQHIL